ENGIRIGVVEQAEELFLRESVAGAAVAADADAEDARAASLALGLENAVEDGVLNAFEVASAEVGVRQRILRVHVLAAAALQHQLHFDMRLAPLVEVKDRRA